MWRTRDPCTAQHSTGQSRAELGGSDQVCPGSVLNDNPMARKTAGIWQRRRRLIGNSGAANIAPTLRAHYGGGGGHVHSSKGRLL